MLIHFLKYLKGYLRIEIEGFSPERFLNLCTGRKILLWNISKEKDRYYCNISIKSFLKLRPLTKKTHTRVHILEKHGLIFLWKKLRKRKCFLTGVFLMFAILTAISFFIWDISISGNCVHTTEELMGFLKENNIYAGSAKSSLDNEEIVRLLRTEYGDITWVSVKIKGTRLYIELREDTSAIAESNSDSEEASDLIAPAEGEIVKIITRAGTPLVKQGDTVSVDSVLVSGRIDIKNDDGEVAAYQYCHADADVFLRYEYVYQESFTLLHEENIYTQNEKKHFVIAIAGKNFAFGKKFPYENYDSTEHSYPLHLFSDFYLPVVFTTKTYREYVKEEKIYTNKEALLLGKEHLTLFCKNLQEKGVQIVENNVKIQCNGVKCFSAGTLTLIEKVSSRKATEILTMPKEDNFTDEFTGTDN